MPRNLRSQDAGCSIAQAAAVIGDWWSLLIVREVARGHRRFEDLTGELAISREVLTERLDHLVDHRVLARTPYPEPARHEYVLTDAGWALAPTLIAMQDWADHWLLGDGALTGMPAADSTEAARVHDLLGTRVPGPLPLPGTGLSPGTAASGTGGGSADVVAETGATVLFTYPTTGTMSPAVSPTVSPTVSPAVSPAWRSVPGAMGCTLENRLFRDRLAEFTAAGVAVHGVSTQPADEQRAFAEAEGIPFPLLSDVDLRLAAALRLPTFRAGGTTRLKRLILVVDRLRVVRHVVFPVQDIPAAVAEALEAARALT